jgi:peptide/nickel transport system substrate-binding protein
MSILRRALPALAAMALVAGACGGDPPQTAPPTGAPSTSPSAAPSVTPTAFQPASFPVDGSACDRSGYTGRMGRIEAVDARTVRFTLCQPDGAFPARLAHPALSIIDSAAVAGLAADPSSARSLAGTGPYVIDRWVPDEDVELRRADTASAADAKTPTIVLRWASDARTRAAAVEDATVDGIDAPGPAELDDIATLPELAVTTRPGLSTAFLAFGSGPAFASGAVRQAIAGAIDRDALTTAAFPAGSVVATHMTPCLVEGACGGKAWYEFNAPAASAKLADQSFDLTRSYPLHIPDGPVPGLPDPAGTAAAVQAQLKDNLGLRTSIDVIPSETFRKQAAAGSLNGLYLDGIASSVADASGFLAPLFGEDVHTTPAQRATGVRKALTEAAATADASDRAAAVGRANSAIRNTAVVVPLAHPGGVVTYRTDVAGVATSPLGLDPLGAAVPGDRPQLVFMQSSEPDGAWCGDQPSLDAYRLCGLLFDGLYGFAAGGLDAEPRLAQSCEADEHATVWTCRLRARQTFSDGQPVDAGDVLATFAAQWDATGHLRHDAPAGAFAGWDELFGAPLDAPG